MEAEPGIGSDHLRQEVLRPSRKIDRLTPRTRTPLETLARAQTCMRQIPITRVTDLTPLDRLRLPVFCAVTPLARDLTTHLGKGLDADQAKASAVMEAIERTCAETVTDPIQRGSLEQMRSSGRIALDPGLFDLPSDSTFHPASSLTWVEARDLQQDQTVWIPRDLAISPPDEGVLREVDTNGLAAGNTLLEAVLHGLCEVIERDAVGQRLFVDMFSASPDGAPPRRRLDPATLPAAAMPISSRIAAFGFEVATYDMTTEIGVATFRTVIRDRNFPSGNGTRLRQFAGYGTDPCSETALLRSITEAVQSRLAVVQGARDSFNRVPTRSRIHHRSADHESPAESTMSFTEVPTLESDDLADDLRFVLDRLRHAGFDRVVVVDLTRSEWGIPVVRVRVPGLTSFLVNRRRPGWRCLRHLL